jgi:hypothetical protein
MAGVKLQKPLNLPFGDWRPDAQAISGQYASAINNLLPTAVGYGPLGSLSAFSSSALPAACVGLFVARTATGGWVIFAGTQTKLYKFTGSAWSDVTRLAGGNYNVPSGEFWGFTQFGSKVIAVNINDAPQVFTIDSSSNFAALGGSPPQARRVFTVGEFVVLAGIANAERKVRWSAISNEASWTIGTNLADEQEFLDGGRVTGVCGDKEGGFIIQEQAIRQFSFLPGSDLVFQFNKIEGAKGCAAPTGWVWINRTVFYVSEDGFYAVGGQGLNPIGANKVNKFFRADMDRSQFFSVVASYDPYNPRILWAYRSSSSVTTYFNRAIFYDWQLDRWGYSSSVSAGFWASLATSSTTLEQLDTLYGALDTLVPYSLDSPVFQGGRPTLAGVNTSGQLCFLEGPSLEASISGGDLELNPGGRSLLTDVQVLTDATPTTSVTVSDAHRDTFASSTTATGTSETSGRCSIFASGRFHKLTATIAASTTWTYLTGLRLWVQPDGEF